MYTGVLWVIYVFFGHGVARYRTCTLQVPYGSRAGTLWTMWITGSGEARECTLGLYLPSQTRLCDIWTVRARKTTNWPSMGTKTLVAQVWKLYMPKFQPRDIRHNSKFYETLCGFAMHAVWLPMYLHGLGPYGDRTLSKSFMLPTHKISNV